MTNSKSSKKWINGPPPDLDHGTILHSVFRTTLLTNRQHVRLSWTETPRRVPSANQRNAAAFFSAPIVIAGREWVRPALFA